MATYTKTVDPNGGSDYTSISAWEAGEQTLYSSGDIAIADCKRTGATKDTTAVTISGWTAGVVPKIIVNSLYRHEGKHADTRTGGNYIYTLSGMAGSAIIIGVASTVVDGIQIETWGSAGGTRAAISTGGGVTSFCEIYKCLITAPTDVASSTMYGIQLVNGCADWKIINNIVWGIKTASNTAYGIQCARGNIVANNTVYNSGTGFTEPDSTNTMVYTNNAGMGNTVADWAGSFSATSDYNVSSDATAPGTNKATSKTAYTDYFVDHANGDFHLKNTSATLWGINSSNLTITFTTDIDNDTRTDSDQFGISADFYTSSGTLYTQDLTASFPSASGSLVKNIGKNLTGDFPAQSGSFTTILGFSQEVAGDFPSPVGALSKQINKNLIGEFTSPSGALTKETSKNLTGDFPSPSGILEDLINFKRSLTGVMGSITGVVSSVLNPVIPLGIKLIKLIGSGFKKLLGG